MKDAWIDTQRRSFPLPVLCDALSVSPSGFRAWQAGGTPQRKRLTDAQALVLIRTIHQEVRQAHDAFTPSCVDVATGSVCRAANA